MALRVYGGLTFLKGKQVRTIVAAKSMKRASELTGESYSYIRKYWSETGNEVECQFALSSPETVFVAESSIGKHFTPV